jgi:hypothetical protein
VFYYIAAWFFGNTQIVCCHVNSGHIQRKKRKFMRQEEIIAAKTRTLLLFLSEEELVYKIQVVFKEADGENS